MFYCYLHYYSDAAKVHLRVASFLESSHSDNLRPVYANLSYHFHAGAVGPMAEQFTRESFKYAVKSADEAIARGANADGITMCKKAYSLLSTVPECEVLLELIDLAIVDLKPPGVVTNIVRRVSVSLAPNGAAAAREREKSTSFTMSKNNVSDTGSILKAYIKIRDMIDRQKLTFAAQMGTPKRGFSIQDLNPFAKPDALMMGPGGTRVAKLSWKATYTKEQHLAWYECSCCHVPEENHDRRR